MPDFKVGDFVEVDLGLALCAIGEIVTENAYRNDNKQSYREHLLVQSLARSGGFDTGFNPKSFKIRFLDNSTHTANPEELRLLGEKEQFILKLKGGEDKNMARIYEAMDKLSNA